jgi:hypothetical protein
MRGSRPLTDDEVSLVAFREEEIDAAILAA